MNNQQKRSYYVPPYKRNGDIESDKDLNDKNNKFILNSIKNKVDNELSRGRYIFNDSYETGTTFLEMIKKLKLTCLSTPDKSISCSIYPNVNTCDLVGLISTYSFKDIKKTQKYYQF